MKTKKRKRLIETSKIDKLVKVAHEVAYASSCEEAQLHTYQLRNVLKEFNVSR